MIEQFADFIRLRAPTLTIVVMLVTACALATAGQFDPSLPSSTVGNDPTVRQAHQLDPALPFTPAASELTTQMLPSIRRAYALGQRGALYASRTEFIQVLRRIATVKDIEHGTCQHSRALAEGLRALDEADDFVPKGANLEADVDVEVVASSHRTPVLRGVARPVSPHQAAALYHSYAQRKLGEAVAGEQAGSMALHGLGKIYSRQAEQQHDDPRAVQRSMTMHQAALFAHPGNHLAANELGVLLAHNGHFDNAAQMFNQAIRLAPSSTAYHNLAIVQQKMGQARLAAANQHLAENYAKWEQANGAVSRRKGIRWVSPDQMARTNRTQRPSPASSGAVPKVARLPQIGPTATPTVPASPQSRASKLVSNAAHASPFLPPPPQPTGQVSDSTADPEDSPATESRSFWRKAMDKATSLGKPRLPWSSRPESSVAPVRTAQPGPYSNQRTMSR